MPKYINDNAHVCVYIAYTNGVGVANTLYVYYC